MSSYYLPSESKIGAGYVAHRLAQVMVDRGNSVTMFSPCRRPADARYDHVAVPMAGSLRTFRWGFRLRGLDLSDFDVYHAHGDDHLRARRNTPAHVRTLHGSCFSEALHIKGVKDRLRMFLLGLTEVVASLRADAAVAVSQNTRRSFPWVRRVIPNGVDLQSFHPGDKEPTPTILFVGTYERRKRGRLLMEAFSSSVLPILPSARLWMVCSDAPEAPNVERLGRLDDGQLADRYRRAWVFCLPSSYEGFGVPYIEAMASGTPVVATANPGAFEVLDGGRAGVIVDDSALGPELVRIMTEPAVRASLSRAGLQRAHDFDWHAVAASYESLYAELLAGGN
ncbi:MAG: phosphatidyl-myo-inositol alpha-mannosyltransferase [Acidimicrobiaceae bacterium]